MPTYEIFVDEAWTHGGDVRRYWCFYGGIFGTSQDLDRLDQKLRATLKKYGVKKEEVKWSSLSAHNVKLYREFADCLLDAVERGEVRFRQMFYDRAFVRLASNPLENQASPLDVQFKLCYQFLKHAFGLKFLPPAPAGQKNEVLVRLDTHSSQPHKDRLVQFAQDLPRMLGRADLELRLTFHRSSQVPRIQVVDLLIGAAGSYGNQMHDLRKDGRRGMTDKQKVRKEFAKEVIYNRLRAIDAGQRKTRAFNWFETTGKDLDWANLLHHNVRIWKFKPQRYQIDQGWQNDHLDKQGNYQGPQLKPVPVSAPPDEAPAFTDES